MTHVGRPKGTGNSVAASRAAFHADTCPRCGDEANITGKDYVCSPCKSTLTKQAQAWQERDYLARYLSTREDEVTAQAHRLRAVALKQGIDWTHPPEPLAFADRMATLMAPFRPQLDLFVGQEAS